MSLADITEDEKAFLKRTAPKIAKTKFTGTKDKMMIHIMSFDGIPIPENIDKKLLQKKFKSLTVEEYEELMRHI